MKLNTAYLALGGIAALALLSQTETGKNVTDKISSLLPGGFQRSITSGRGAQYYATIEAIGRAAGLPENMLSRLAYQESRFNPNAKNAGSGAIGMFQIVPRWHPNAQPLDWRAAAAYAADYLAKLKKQFGTWSKALAAYNWGPGNIAKNGLNNLPAETRNYYQQIMADIGLQPGIA